jgi:hypothetical protein
VTNSIVLQPAGSKSAKEHYFQTVANLVDLQTCDKFLSSEVLNRLILAHPTNKAAMWGVEPSSVNTNKWNKVSEGNLVLFSSDGRIHTSGVVSTKFNSRELASQLWGTTSDGNTWSLMYSLDEIRTLNISYLEFNKVVGYEPNYVIQGFNVLDEERSSRFLDHYSLRSERHPEEITDEEFEEALIGLDGELDRKAVGWHRKEQSKARKRLLKKKAEGRCLICGKEMLAEFLVAAHIKKRSECTDEEKRDIDGVMMLACKFGCDYLFEAGYISVQDKIVVISEKLIDDNASQYSASINGRQLESTSKQDLYFSWHLSNRFLV